MRGGLSETFVTQELKVDAFPLRKRLLEAIDELSKHVHGLENTIINSRDEQDAMAEITVAAATAFLDAINNCRSAVLEPIAEGRKPHISSIHRNGATGWGLRTKHLDGFLGQDPPFV